MATYQGPNGWTADSVVGAINAAAQAPITADTLLTSRGAARDPSLESRQFMNPYTGVRDPVLEGSVYARPDVPAWLAGEVSALNAEQALRRSAQAEIFNKIFSQAQGDGPGSLPWLEVLRAAVLQPGVEAGFGSQIVDPNIGIAARDQAIANQTAASAYANTLNDAVTQRRANLQAANRGSDIFNTGWSVAPRVDERANYRGASRSADSVAQSVIGTNPFAASQGYIGSYGGAPAPAAPAPIANTSPFASSRLQQPGYVSNDQLQPGGTGPFASSRLTQPGYIAPTPWITAPQAPVRAPATNQAYSWAGGYVGPTQFSLANPTYNAYAGSNFLR